MRRTDILDSRGRVAVWRIKCGPLQVDRLVEPDHDETEGVKRVQEILYEAGFLPPATREGEFSAEWLREVGTLTAAELILFPDRPYVSLTKEERNLCNDFAASWAMELEPEHWIDYRRDKDQAPGYGIGAMMWEAAA